MSTAFEYLTLLYWYALRYFLPQYIHHCQKVRTPLVRWIKGRSSRSSGLRMQTATKANLLSVDVVRLHTLCLGYVRESFTMM